MIEISAYNLPDLSLIKEEKLNQFYTWNPDKVYLILGASNKAEENINFQPVINDNVIVQKRKSGGETVLLTPKTLVIAFLTEYKKKQPNTIFKEINNRIIIALNKLGVNNIKTNGISDLSIGEKKIMGSSLQKTKKHYFYHAVLNINENPDLIAKYIKHPKREPEYRKTRKHCDFITSLHREGHLINPIDLINNLNS